MLIALSANGMWSDWNEYACSTSSISDRVRTRSCTNPKPANGGAYCVGEATETETCSSGTPVCYAGGSCGCEKNVGTTERGDGTTQGSCATDAETCYSDGLCKSKYKQLLN